MSADKRAKEIFQEICDLAYELECEQLDETIVSISSKKLGSNATIKCALEEIYLVINSACEIDSDILCKIDDLRTEFDEEIF